MPRTKLRLLLVGATAIGVATTTPQAARAQTDTGAAVRVDRDDDDGMDLGWIGLLGLAGLLGLRRRETTVVHRDVPPGSPGTHAR